MVERIALVTSGLLAWTFLEYLIHGWLSHAFKTFAMLLHAVHHRDPNAVFTIGAWIPLAALWLVSIFGLGLTDGVLFFTGTLAGFIGYEAIHYRLHFCHPRSRLEIYLRTRHLIHHEYSPAGCFGVTSAFWDLVFGTEPTGAEITKLHESLASRPPISGRTNVYKLKDFVLGRGLATKNASRVA